MKRILVTGGAGFIGSNLTDYMLAHHTDIQITIVDALDTGSVKANIEYLLQRYRERCRFVQADITDREHLRSIFAEGYDTVANFAGISAESRALVDEAAARHSNTEGVQALFDVARECGVQLFYHHSTCEVYGNHTPGTPPFLPDSPLNPRAPYNQTKAAGDIYLQENWADTEMQVIIGRSCNVYGPRQHPEKVGPLFITNALLGQPSFLHGDGAQRREWIHISDACSAIDTILREGKGRAIYNIGTGQEASIGEIASMILDELNLDPSHLKTTERRPLDDDGYLMDSASTRALGWEPHIELREGLETTIHWYQTHPEWWQPIRCEMAEGTIRTKDGGIVVFDKGLYQPVSGEQIFHPHPETERS